jgi:hypothetical protein
MGAVKYKNRENTGHTADLSQILHFSSFSLVVFFFVLKQWKK